MKKKAQKRWKRFKQVLPYFLVSAVTVSVAVLGTIDKKSAEINLSLNTMAESDYKVSVDQVSELYVVADLSDALGFASAGDVAANYVIANTMIESGQTSSGKLEKPTIADVGASRGVIEYTVLEGENADTIAAKFGLSGDQVRWSNGLKNANVAAGTVLYLPSTSGIVYTVKSGDTVDLIASKYGSNTAEIIALNDLEVSGVTEGMKIIVKDGNLPDTERPEYVAPVRRTYTYTYLGNTSERHNLRVEGYLSIGGGQCVDYALYKRPDLREMYGFSLGNANTWAARATRSLVDRNPAAGAIFQTSGGWFGHVGYVEWVNPDGSIEVTEMNYGYVPYRVVRSTIPANAVGNFYYIH